MNHLAEREREKKKRREKKRKKKELSTQSNLGPLILRDIGLYAYNSKGVSVDTLKGPGENTDEALFTLSFSFLSERFSSVHAKAALSYIVEMNNTGVTGRILQPNTDFEHARVWPT